MLFAVHFFFLKPEFARRDPGSLDLDPAGPRKPEDARVDSHQYSVGDVREVFWGIVDQNEVPVTAGILGLAVGETGAWFTPGKGQPSYRVVVHRVE